MRVPASARGKGGPWTVLCGGEAGRTSFETSVPSIRGDTFSKESSCGAFSEDLDSDEPSAGGSSPSCSFFDW